MGSRVSKHGLGKAMAIIRHEVALARVESAEGSAMWERDPGLYFFSVFGDLEGNEPLG